MPSVATRVHPTHGISLEKALKASAKVSTLVSMAAPMPSIATAPRGSGVVMMPTMVPTKTESRCLFEGEGTGGSTGEKRQAP